MNGGAMRFTVSRVQAYVDGATVSAVKDRDSRIHYQWSGSVTDGVRRKAERRLAAMLRKFDIGEPVSTKQLSLPNEAP